MDRFCIPKCQIPCVYIIVPSTQYQVFIPLSLFLSPLSLVPSPMPLVSSPCSHVCRVQTLFPSLQVLTTIPYPLFLVLCTKSNFLGPSFLIPKIFGHLIILTQNIHPKMSRINILYFNFFSFIFDNKNCFRIHCSLFNFSISFFHQFFEKCFYKCFF